MKQKTTQKCQKCVQKYSGTDKKWDCERYSDSEWKVTACQPLTEEYHG